jgi:hypothetical protein
VTTAPPLIASADPLAAFRRGLMRLVGYATDLYHDLATATAERPRAYLPTIARRNLPAGRRRVTHALTWLIALSRTLAGDRFYLPQTEPRPAPTAPKSATRKTTATTERRHRTEAERDRATLSRIRRCFATQPIGLIAERLARRLRIDRSDEIFPHAIAGLTETPAEFQKRWDQPQPAARPDYPQAPDEPPIPEPVSAAGQLHDPPIL